MGPCHTTMCFLQCHEQREIIEPMLLSIFELAKALVFPAAEVLIGLSEQRQFELVYPLIIHAIGRQTFEYIKFG